MPTFMPELHTSGVNLNANAARNYHPDFEEKIIPVDEAGKAPYACPECQGRQLMLYGTVQRTYVEGWQEGKRKYSDVDKWKSHHLEIIECFTCKKRFFIRHELPPLVPQPSRHSPSDVVEE
jgi:uncharacterized protein YbaR (Trm112 family)